MKFLLSLCLVVCLAVASLGSPIVENDSADAESYDSTTEQGSGSEDAASPETETREGRCFSGCLALDGIYNSFEQILKSNFGCVPNFITSNLMNQLTVIVLGREQVSIPPIAPVTTTTTTTETPVEPPPQGGCAIASKCWMWNNMMMGSEQVQFYDMKFSSSVLSGLFTTSVTRAYGKNADKTMQIQRYAMYRKGQNVKLDAPLKSVRVYRRSSLDKSCSSYLKVNANQKKNTPKKVMLSAFCKRVVHQ
ncbi:hypothetical protein QAD02_022304 [Eretmocerus hayati]|uniref:Uncharacterized protein n=1 Tax=Eretmocerus hayati TaxID=131215 RepID=A0ACC2PSX5_9HYME|nr:hypothetical protein QAD02_022304 [Eretmocerus hayati]